MVVNSPPTITGGRYQLLNKLGAGGMGVVYRAYDRLMGRHVALKHVKLSQEPADDSPIRIALAQEFQILASLRHPHVISVLDFGFDAGQAPYFTMDLLVYPETILAAGQKLPLAGKVDLLVQVLQALAYVHRRGILHRDLKPGNILVSDHQVRVLDFGLSMQINPPGVLLGTPAYIAPELLQGDTASPASDLYAVGIIAYELFTGQHPFDIDDISHLFSQVLNTKPSLQMLQQSLESADQPPTMPSRLPELDLDDTVDALSKAKDATRPGSEKVDSDEDTTVVHKSDVSDETTHPNASVAPTRPRIPLDTSASGSVLDAIEPGSEHPLVIVVSRLLEKRPEDRYANAISVIYDLSEAIGVPLPVETVATRESFLQAAHFVGRESQLDQLKTALESAIGKHGSAWLIGGESGVGKSRLLSELRTHALVAGALVWRGQAISEAGGPYHAWREPLRRLILNTELSDADAALLKLVVPDIDNLLGRPINAATELDPEQMRSRLNALITSVFHRQTQPVVLILEDLHWAGSESLSVLQQICLAVQDLPLLILASYRDDEKPGLPKELPEMQALKLERLKEQDIATLSESMLGDAGRRPEVLTLLRRETEGNVFFLVEVVRALAEEAGQLEKIGVMTLPAHVFAGGIERIVKRRLDRLPAEAYPLLDLGAVFGRQLDLAVLQAATPGVDLETWVQLCSDAAVLDFQEGVWQFTHDKLREGVLNALRPDVRPELHRQIAVAVEKVYPDQVVTLAYHWRMAGDVEQELKYVILAGELSDRVSLFQDSVTYFRRALKLLDEKNGTSQRAHLKVKLGRVYARLNAHNDAARCLKDALTLAADTGDREVTADALVWLGNITRVQGQHDDAANYYAQGLATSREIGARHQEADALRGLARIAGAKGQYSEAQQRLEESLGISRKIDDPEGSAHALSDLAVVATMQGTYDEAVLRLEESLSIFTRIGDRCGVANALVSLGMTAHYQGAPDKGVQYWEKSLSISREIGDRWSVGATLNNLGYSALLQGNYTQVETYLEESLDIFRDVGDLASAVQALINLGHAASALNDNEKAAEHYCDALQSALQIDAAPLLLEIVAGIARLRIREGKANEALGLVSLALHHPGTNSDIKAIAEPLLDELRNTLPAADIKTALDAGQVQDLKAVATKLLDSCSS